MIISVDERRKLVHSVSSPRADTRFGLVTQMDQTRGKREIPQQTINDYIHSVLFYIHAELIEQKR